MTNGGGSTEADRVARLSAELGMPVSSSIAWVYLMLILIAF